VLLRAREEEVVGLAVLSFECEAKCALVLLCRAAADAFLSLRPPQPPPRSARPKTPKRP
jgi:hypothetical protein